LKEKIKKANKNPTLNDGIKKNKESWNNQKEKKTKSSMQGLGLIFFLGKWPFS